MCIKCIWSAGKTNVTKLPLTDKGQFYCMLCAPVWGNICQRQTLKVKGDLVHHASSAHHMSLTHMKIICVGDCPQCKEPPSNSPVSGPRTISFAWPTNQTSEPILLLEPLSKKWYVRCTRGWLAALWPPILDLNWTFSVLSKGRNLFGRLSAQVQWD
jgi:hypothetical protein